MIVCHCGVVTDRTVRASIENGARTVGQVCRETGAGQNCGVCVFSVKRLLCEHESISASPAPEVDVAAS